MHEFECTKKVEQNEMVAQIQRFIYEMQTLQDNMSETMGGYDEAMRDKKLLSD